jgi:hypothetical protein
MGHRASLLAKERGIGVLSIGPQQRQNLWESGVVFAHSHTQNKLRCHALTTHLPLNFHLVVYNVYSTQ